MFLITASYCCDPNIFFLITPQTENQSAVRASAVLLVTSSVQVMNGEKAAWDLSPPPEITPCTDTALGCCYPPECADSFLHSYSHVHVWASQTLLSWPVGRMFLCNNPGVKLRSRASTCLILLEGRWCRQQPPAGFKNKVGVKCRRSGSAPAVYLRMAEAL